MGLAAQADALRANKEAMTIFVNQPFIDRSLDALIIEDSPYLTYRHLKRAGFIQAEAVVYLFVHCNRSQFSGSKTRFCQGCGQEIKGVKYELDEQSMAEPDPLRDRLDLKKLGEAVRAKRRLQQMSLAQAADQVEVPPHIIAMVESGERAGYDDHSLLALIEWAGLSVDAVLKKEGA